MKLTLSRAAEFMDATGEFDPKAIATGSSASLVYMRGEPPHHP